MYSNRKCPSCNQSDDYHPDPSGPNGETWWLCEGCGYTLDHNNNVVTAGKTNADEHTYTVEIVLDEMAGTKNEYQKIITIEVTVRGDGLYYADLGDGEQSWLSHNDLLRDLSYLA